MIAYHDLEVCAIEFAHTQRITMVDEEGWPVEMVEGELRPYTLDT